MLTLILALFAASGTFCTARFGFDAGAGWSAFWAIAGFLAVQAGLSFYFMRKVKADTAVVQGIIVSGGKAAEAKMRMWQFRPPGSMKEAQRIIEADMAENVRKALEETKRLDKYCPWVMMFSRQIATMKLHLHWMIKDFAAVDELMPKALILDPASYAMKMARLYMLDAKTEEIEKVYAKATARTRYNQNVIPAACMSWILVKRAEKATDPNEREALSDKAFKVLGDALKKSDNETLKRNHELLMNNRLVQFNNSGLGDQWYTLHLETPKMKTQRQRAVYR